VTIAPSVPWGTVVAAFVGGVVSTAIVAVVVVRGGVHHAAASPESAYKIDGDNLVIKPSAVPMKFDTAPVELGAPLARAPVTARVATVEARTGPSFAPLDGRVVEVAVHIGDHVKQGDRLVMVRSGDLATMERELRAAQLAIQTKQALADRMKLLVESRAASQNDLMVAQGELAEAKLTAAAADAKLRSLTDSMVPGSGSPCAGGWTETSIPTPSVAASVCATSLTTSTSSRSATVATG
jgi:cobalt-zinc-cadmium efflux system membrane fusion protein